MDYMVKFYHSYSEGFGSYYITYRLYASSSLDGIKRDILRDLSYEFSSVGLGKEILGISLSLSLEDIANAISEMVDSLGSYSSSWRDKMEDYEIEISECESLNEVVKFYRDFISHCDELGDDEGSDKQIAFEFDGHLSKKLRNVIEVDTPIGDYLGNLLSEYNIYIDWKFINKLETLGK